VSSRTLTEPERALVSAIIAQLPSEVARPLADQLDTVGVATAQAGTVLDLDVPESAPVATVADGPLPVRALVANDAGEIIVWVTNGRLSGLEFAWVTDEPPPGWPSPDELTFL
jgi:hypothetical protein